MRTYIHIYTYTSRLAGPMCCDTYGYEASHAGTSHDSHMHKNESHHKFAVTNEARHKRA